MLLYFLIPWMFLILLPWLPQAKTRPLFIAMALSDTLQAIFGLSLGQSFHGSWWPSLGLNIALAVTPFSQPLLWLNGIVLLSIACTNQSPSRDSVFWLSLAYSGVSLAFLSRNLLLYFLGFEIAVLPFYLLVRKEGGTDRRAAALYFLAFSAIAGMFLLAATLTLVVHHITTFDSHVVPRTLQFSVYGLLLVMWAIKTPLWPFHLWLPRTHGEASTPVSMYLSGVALKVAPFGFLSFSSMLAPAIHHASSLLALWGALTVLLGSLLALGQTDLKQTVAQSSIASMGYVLIALSFGTSLGNQAAILIMIGHGLASPLLFLVTSRIYDLIGSRQIQDMTGLYQKSPALVSWLTVGAFAYMGIPGLALFPGEFGVVMVALQRDPVILYLIIPAMLFMAATWLRVLARVHFGHLTRSTSNVSSRTGSVWSAAWLGIPLILIGIAPIWWTHIWNWGGLK
ncbi:NADH dehydrogenase [Sulfobacillus thermotolerans]|uniref:NADH dehydrogenase n=1 Tax=Sulfobacillus thermotolerans TaxID=338644 RepID=A0ABM6RP99_9FIRM|nr:NADH dehydrogenase [Sulfobacillus thermotolerans]